MLLYKLIKLIGGFTSQSVSKDIELLQTFIKINSSHNPFLNTNCCSHIIDAVNNAG